MQQTCFTLTCIYSVDDGLLCIMLKRLHGYLEYWEGGLGERGFNVVINALSSASPDCLDRLSTGRVDSWGSEYSQ